MRGWRIIKRVILGIVLIYLGFAALFLVYTRFVFRYITKCEYSFDYWDDNNNILHDTISYRFTDEEREQLIDQLINAPIRLSISSEGYFSKYLYVILKTDFGASLKLYMDHPGHSAIWKFPFMPLGYFTENYHNQTNLNRLFDRIIFPSVKDYKRIGAG